MAESNNNLEEYLAEHYIHRSNWLRAAVLGANDGILSTASIAIGVAAASATRDPIVLATLAGLVAGALSMAAGEYVSVSSQTDIEQADIERERQELLDMPEIELQRLADIYEDRGLKKETALIVAKELTEHDALGAHVRDELGITDASQANPVQAAIDIFTLDTDTKIEAVDFVDECTVILSDEKKSNRGGNLYRSNICN